jgi:hypothetical protein
MSSMTVPGFRSLLLRKHSTDLKRTHARDIPHEAAKLGANWRASHGAGGEVHYPNGSILELGHCQNEDDVSIYLSAEYDAIGFDELVTFSEYQYLMIRSRARTTKPGLVPRVFGVTNPGVSPVNPAVPGLAESWVKRRWIDKDVTQDEDESYREDDYAYLPATLDDNPHLNRVEYEKVLRSLPPELRKAYLEGSWDIFMGQFFPEFNKDWHVQELEAPASFPRTCGLDWGFANEGVCLWGVVLPDGQLLIEDEYTFNGQRRAKQIAREVADQIRQRNVDRGLQIRGTYADPAMFAPTGHIGETIAETFGKARVPLTAANNDRVNGWQRLRAWLRAMPKAEAEPVERPWLIIHPRCQQLIRSLPQLVMDPAHPEDCETTRTPDHWADALRYLMAGRPAPTPAFTGEPDYTPNQMGYLKRQILNGSRRKPLGAHAVRGRPRYAY